MREYWECDRCGRHILKGDPSGAASQYEVTAQELTSIPSRRRFVVALCITCFDQVQGVIQYGKVAANPPPPRPPEGTC